jgi:hypothetical protein
MSTYEPALIAGGLGTGTAADKGRATQARKETATNDNSRVDGIS